MIKRLVLALAVGAGLIACAPSGPAPADLCSLLPEDQVARDVDADVSVTKRIAAQPEGAWVYCLYGTPTRHYATVSAPIRHVAGNVTVQIAHDVPTEVRERWLAAATRPLPENYALAAIDLPNQCSAITPAAQRVVGATRNARGSASATSLTCDFIGERGSIAAQARAQAFPDRSPDGERFVDEPDAVIAARVGDGVTDLSGYVDHRTVIITVTAGTGDEQRRFASAFADASWL